MGTISFFDKPNMEIELPNSEEVDVWLEELLKVTNNGEKCPEAMQKIIYYMSQFGESGKKQNVSDYLFYLKCKQQFPKF